MLILFASNTKLQGEMNCRRALWYGRLGLPRCTANGKLA